MATRTMTRVMGAVLAAAAALLPTRAQAQDMPAPDGVRRWDVTASLGSFDTSRRSVGCDPYTPCDEFFVYRFEAGRYWTTRLKSDVGIALTGAMCSFSYGCPSPSKERLYEWSPGGDSYAEREFGLTMVSPGVSYEFRDHGTARPYVSGGVRLEWIREHYSPTEVRDFVQRTSYSVPPEREHTTSFRVRPFVGAGYKFYLGRRVYVGPEAVVAFWSSGISDVRSSAVFGFRF